MWGLIFLVLIFSFAIPAFIIGKKSLVQDLWVAIFPVIGPLIVLLRAARISAWWALAFLIPAGGFGLYFAVAYKLPRQHGRNQLWTIALFIPLINIPFYWVYAFTLDEWETRTRRLEHSSPVRFGEPRPPPAAPSNVPEGS